MKTLSKISAEDSVLLPIIPLLCLGKANSDNRKMNAKSEAIVLEAAVQLGLYDELCKCEPMKHGNKKLEKTNFTGTGEYFLLNLLFPPLTSHHISLIYILQSWLDGTANREEYIAQMLSCATRICSLEMDSKDLATKTIMLSNIVKTLKISERQIAQHTVLQKLLDEMSKDDFIFIEAKHNLQENLVNPEDVLLENISANHPHSLEDVWKTMTIDGMRGRLVENDFFTADEVLQAVAKSFSLNLQEKKRVLMAMPTLSVFQIVSLMHVFAEEKTQFADLAKEHPGNIRILCLGQQLDWFMLKQELAGNTIEEMDMTARLHALEMMKEDAA